MLAPFVLPQVLVFILIVLPVGVHITQQGRVGRPDGRPNVRVGAAPIAVRFKRAVAFIGPVISVSRLTVIGPGRLTRPYQSP